MMNLFTPVGIYLEHNGNCYLNGSYFWDKLIKEYYENSVLTKNELKCFILPSTSLSGGEWVLPSGMSVKSKSSTFSTVSLPPSGIGFYIKYNQYIESSDDGWYKCCLPTSCSDSSTNIITANIFSKCSHCTSIHTVICY